MNYPIKTLVIIGTIMLMLPLISCGLPHNTQSPKKPLDDYWPQWRRNIQHTAYTNKIGYIPNPPPVMWKTKPGGLVEPSAAIGDIDNDGKIEVLGLGFNGKLWCYNGEDGTPKWSYQLPTTSTGNFQIGSPVLGDIDNDNKIDIVCLSYNGWVVALSNTGAKKWEYNTTVRSTYSSPVIADIDGGGDIEIVVFNNHLRVLKGSDGSEKYPKIYIGFDTTSTPAVGNLDGDSKPEIVVGSGKKLHVFNVTSGSLVKKWEFDTGISGSYCASPSIGDIDNDGMAEVVYVVKKTASSGTPGTCAVYSLRGTDGTKKWSVKFTGYGTTGLTSSPAIGDVDSDGKIEVICANSIDGNITSFNGANGAIEWNYECTGTDIIESSPAIGDIDGDGVKEVLCGAHNAYLHCLNGKTGALKWKFYAPGGDDKIVSSPSIADCNDDDYVEIVFGSNGGDLYVLGTTIPQFDILILPVICLIAGFIIISQSGRIRRNYQN